jgi:hypothetical protein
MQPGQLFRIHMSVGAMCDARRPVYDSSTAKHWQGLMAVDKRVLLVRNDEPFVRNIVFIFTTFLY